MAILRLTLRPVDDNQRMDQRLLHEEPLASATIDDSMVITKFESHLDSFHEWNGSFRLSIFSMGQELIFEVTPNLKETGSHRALEFVVI